MTERERREEFLQSRGSFPSKKRRERLIQRAEVVSRIDHLREQIRQFEGATDAKAVALRNAWRRELITKYQLLLDLGDGKPVSREDINKSVNAAAVIRKAAQSSRSLETAATRGGR